MGAASRIFKRLVRQQYERAAESSVPSRFYRTASADHDGAVIIILRGKKEVTLQGKKKFVNNYRRYRQTNELQYS